MKIHINLSKAELDLLEEALVQYQNLLIKTEGQEEIVKYELHLCRRVFEEFGMEDLAEVKEGEVINKTTSTANNSNQFPVPNQRPFSR